jgi:hypothetical protein
MVAGMVVAISLHFTRRTVEIGLEVHITDRFTKANDQLGARSSIGEPLNEVRIGGIYSLERVAGDSARDRPVVEEILAGYIRQNSSFSVDSSHCTLPFEVPSILAVNIQAILSALRRLREEPVWDFDRRLNLHGVNIRSGEMQGVCLEGVELRSSCLDRVILQHSYLGPSA